MGRFFKLLPTLAIYGISFTISVAVAAAEWAPPVPSHFDLDPGQSPPISGPRLRRQYYGGPYEYQSAYNQDYPYQSQDSYPYQEYAYKPSNYRSPILSSRAYHASARNLASYLATDDYDDYYAYNCPPNNPRQNKKNGMKIFQEVIGNKITRNMDKYFLPTYIQHNPGLADGIEALRKALQPGGLLFGPREQIDFQHVGSDGDLVYIHARRVRASGEVFAYMDIFRFECGKIAEHWDVIQSTELDTKAENDHPFF